MRLLLLPLLVLFPLTSAAADLAGGLSQCATLSDGGQRLACFDRLAASIAAAPLAATPVAPNTAAQSPTAGVAAVAPEPVVPAQAPAATPATQPAAAPAASERFGLELQQAPVEQLEQIRATVVKRKKDPYGKWVITLDNGQVWKQSESTSFSFASDQVTIERGLLGAFYLRADGQNKTIKVKRQQ